MKVLFYFILKFEKQKSKNETLQGQMISLVYSTKHLRKKF